ncbi:MAG: hypothetical protein C4331_19565 [Meiothermus sp.]
MKGRKRQILTDTVGLVHWPRVRGVWVQKGFPPPELPRVEMLLSPVERLSPPSEAALAARCASFAAQRGGVRQRR